MSFEGQAKKAKAQSGSQPLSGSKPVSGRKPPMTRGKANDDKSTNKPANKTPEACKPKEKPSRDEKPPPPPPSSSPNQKGSQGKANPIASKAKTSVALSHTYQTKSRKQIAKFVAAIYTRRKRRYSLKFGVARKLTPMTCVSALGYLKPGQTHRSAPTLIPLDSATTQDVVAFPAIPEEL